MSDRPIAVSAPKAAELLSIGRSTFWKLVSEGSLPQGIKIGGSTRWLVSDLEQHLLASRTTRPSASDVGLGTQPGYTQP
jgi:predicted DNA-binding transcriptional regulator AlpA